MIIKNINISHILIYLIIVARTNSPLATKGVHYNIHFTPFVSTNISQSTTISL